MSTDNKDKRSMGMVARAGAHAVLVGDGNANAAPGMSHVPGAGLPSGAQPGVIHIRDRLREKGMLVSGSTLGIEARAEFRRIKRPLLQNAFGKSSSLVDTGNLIMVTSAVPGEGKTYVAVNLALSLAHERDHTVLLVDSDVTKQGVSRLLGIERRRPDFTDLLANETIPAEDALLSTDVPGLMLLPAGKPHEYITEMVRSQRMRDIFAELAGRHQNRIVVMDLPPLISAPEAQVLVSMAGQIVYVVEAGKTPHSVVEEAISMLPEDKAIGVVLNKSESITNHGGYYYNYYKAYGEEDATTSGED